MSPSARARAVQRVYLVSIVLAATAFAVWLAAYTTDTINLLRLPWDSLIYGAVIVTLVTLTASGTLAVLTSPAGRWRLLVIGPLVAVGFLWWVLVFYGQASVGLGAGTSQDVIAEFASQPSYVPIMTLLTFLIGLPLVVPWLRARRSGRAQGGRSSE